MERQCKERKETEDKLHQQYKDLQQEWDSIKQSKPKALRRSSTDPRIMVKALQLVDNSPRNLKSSLQYWRSPSDQGGRAWKVRNNDLAIEEILRERRAAIESGKLKGRRLFEAVEDASDVDFAGREEIICGGWDGFVQESELRSVCSYDSDDENENLENKEGLSAVCCHWCSYSSSSSSSSYLCDECMARQMAVKKGEKIVVANVQEEEKGSMSGADGNRTRRMVLTGWLVIGLILCAISIISMKSFGGYRDQDELILVPT